MTLEGPHRETLWDMDVSWNGPGVGLDPQPLHCWSDRWQSLDWESERVPAVSLSGREALKRPLFLIVREQINMNFQVKKANQGGQIESTILVFAATKTCDDFLFVM